MENHNLTEDQSFMAEPVRPQFLTVLCVLSYIWSGILLFFLALCLLFNDFIFKMAQSVLSGETSVSLDENTLKAVQTLVDLGPQKFLIGIAVAIIMYMTSLLGVFKMWRLQKTGFYIYAAVNGLGVMYDIISGSYIMCLLSLAFIGMYFSNLKYMNR